MAELFRDDWTSAGSTGALASYDSNWVACWVSSGFVDFTVDHINNRVPGESDDGFEYNMVCHTEFTPAATQWAEYTQATGNLPVGCAVRCLTDAASGGTTGGGYHAYATGSNWEIWRADTDYTRTRIGNGSATTGSTAGGVGVLEADGSDLTFTWQGNADGSATDSTFSSGYCGMFAFYSYPVGEFAYGETAASTVTGTGATDGTVGTVSGSGNVTITGTGAVDAPVATVSGTADTSSEVTGTGAVTAPAATASGSGDVTITGTGSVTAPAPTVAGSGDATIAGTGSVTAPAPTAAGSGNVDVEGTGAVTAPAPSLAGSGNVTITGTGAVDGTVGEAVGTDSEDAEGTGAVDAPVATVSGSGNVTITGTGAVTAPAATLAGTAAQVITGTGAVDGVVATASGGDGAASTQNLKVGGSAVDAVFLGSTAAKVYLGSTLIHEN